MEITDINKKIFFTNIENNDAIKLDYRQNIELIFKNSSDAYWANKGKVSGLLLDISDTHIVIEVYVDTEVQYKLSDIEFLNKL